ncbi:hypothetical protein GE061_000369 [Apolygus lucorum]|uniref:Uncharacterized protein n=1 Tax=Apolygus lucorum TaxID=248454 RepID=A0A8S9Y425_APOLU|nr:hypothetical protein GE061_000369 [Apolygus lucorum]
MNEWMDDLDTHLDTMDHQYPTGVMPGGEDKEEKELFIGPKTPAGPGRRGDIKLRKQKAASKAPRQFTALVPHNHRLAPWSETVLQFHTRGIEEGEWILEPHRLREEMETEDESEPEHQPEGGSDSDGEPRVEAGEESITEESSGEEEQEGARHHYDDLRRLAEDRLLCMRFQELQEFREVNRKQLHQPHKKSFQISFQLPHHQKYSNDINITENNLTSPSNRLIIKIQQHNL